MGRHAIEGSATTRDDETAPTPATEDGAADQKVDGAGLNPKEPFEGPADDRPQTLGGEQVDPSEPF
jgi:hypothetical protein